MLFNSYEFLFAFLPLTFLGFLFLARKFGHTVALRWLLLASVSFYGWWEPRYLLLLVPMVLTDWLLGLAIAAGPERLRSWLLGLGIAGHLALLGYFKYAGFFAETLQGTTGIELGIGAVLLPIGLSFYTFQSAAYLIDVRRGCPPERRLDRYALFVTFFPHLIAGPIVHHRELLPQFDRPWIFRFDPTDVAAGITIFVIGLVKKAVLADGIAPLANQMFAAAAQGAQPGFFEAWGGALAYALQLYFDFSGYCDMAVGAARMFGITLPINFNSPYKATSIIDFWRRWHITLSRFLRDYLYFSLGGNRKGTARRHLNLIVTMLLGGFWHGAGWTFLLWGLLHGLLLTANHLWRDLAARLRLPSLGAAGRILAWLLTFTAVVAGWVLFRAADLVSAGAILKGMAGLNGITLPDAFGHRLGAAKPLLEAAGLGFTPGGGERFLRLWIWCVGLTAACLLLPNTQQIVAAYAGHTGRQGLPLARFRWSPGAGAATAVGLATALGILSLAEVSEFLYFQF